MQQELLQMPKTLYTIGDLVKFIQDFKGGKAFNDWTEEQIYAAIVRAYQDNTLAITHDSEGNLTGIIHWMEMSGNIIHIHNLVTNGSKGVIQGFMQIFNSKYEGWCLQGMRFGKLKSYGAGKNVDRLSKKGVK